MDTKQIGEKLVEYCNSGNEKQALDTLYDQSAVSIEAMPGPTQTSEGLDAIRGKHEWWNNNTIVHSSSAKGPYPLGDRFAIYFEVDMTMKDGGARTKMQEVGLYTVANGKIVKEEFFYDV